MAEGGRVNGDCLECPFHGWSFRGEDGNCDNIPYTEKGINQVLHNIVLDDIYLPFRCYILHRLKCSDCFLYSGTTFLHRNAYLRILTYKYLRLNFRYSW